jgi:AcrR family transcriptional regulator
VNSYTSVVTIPDPPSTSRSPRAERTRQRILDAAGQCFAAAGGYAKATVEDVASRAGVSKTLVYQHFRSKEEILEAVLERTLNAWDEITPPEAIASGESVLEGLARMHREGLEFAGANPVLRALLELDSRILLDPGTGGAVGRSMARLRQALADAFAAGIRSGELRADLDVDRAAEVFLVHHLAFIQAVLDPSWVDVSDEALVDSGLDILFHGLAGQRV